MTDVNKKIFRILLPIVMIGALTVVVAMHFFITNSFNDLTSFQPEHAEVIKKNIYNIDLFVFFVTVIAASIFLWVATFRFTRFANQDLNKYLLALESASNHIIITDVDGRILYCNKGAEKLTGYTYDEMKGNTPRLWGGLMPIENYKNLWKTIKYDRQTFSAEVKNRRKNQDEYFALMHISPILDIHNNVTGFVSTEEDITKQRQREKIIQQSEAKYRNLVNTMQEGLGVQDQNGNIVFMNRRGCEMLGYTLKELLGKPVEFVFDEKNRKIFREQMKKHSQEKHQSYEIAWLRRDGTIIDTITSPSPYFDETGKLVESVAVFTDISKEKEIDRSKTEFVSLASHQLRTPLATVKWYIEMLLAGDAGKLTIEQNQYAQEIYYGNQRMVELVDALLNVSHLELGTFTTELEDFDLNALYSEIEISLSSLKSYNKNAITTHFPKVSKIKSDKKMIRIILENLLSNAIKYTGASSQIDLYVNMVKPGKIIGGKTIEKDSLAITLSDNGYGIPKNQQDRMFTKFFRADNVRAKDTDGTGLGLYIVKSIVDHCNGMIWFDSEENKGTTFHIILPTAKIINKD